MSTRYVVLRSYNAWSYTTNCQYTISDFVDIPDSEDHEKVLREYTLKLFIEAENVNPSITEDNIYWNRRSLSDRHSKVFAENILIAEYPQKHVTYGFLPVDNLNDWIVK